MHIMLSLFFFFNDTATTEIYTLSLHDALPILLLPGFQDAHVHPPPSGLDMLRCDLSAAYSVEDYERIVSAYAAERSEEHTSELQSRQYLVCRLLLEKKKKNIIT